MSITSDLHEAAKTSPDRSSRNHVRHRSTRVLRPHGALARFDEIAVWLAGWQQTPRPAVRHPVAVVFAGDHGVADEQVSAYPSSVTSAMVEALRAGTATASVMASDSGARLEVVDVGVGKPTGNIRTGAALDSDQFDRAVEMGRKVVADADPIDLLLPGEIGIGNTTPAAAICMALFGGSASRWVGPGTGLDPEGLARKRTVVAEAVARLDTADPLEVLRHLGGWELAAIAGAVIEARGRSIPVLLDGFVATAAVMPLEAAHPGFLDHCWPGHVSAEPGHAALVARLGKPPLLDLEMRLGESSGSLAALPLVRLAARAVMDVATFDEVGLG